MKGTMKRIMSAQGRVARRAARGASRRWLLAAGVAASATPSVSVLAACDSRDRSAATAPGPQVAPASIRFLHWDGGAFGELWQAKGHAFMEEFPAVTLDVVRVPYGQGYSAKLQAEILAGDPPAAAAVHPNDFLQYAATGNLTDLEPRMKQDRDFPRKDIYEVSIEDFRVDGRVYGVTKGLAPRALFYNKSLFDQAGLPPPTADWSRAYTWLQLREVAQRLTRPNGEQWGLGLDLNYLPTQVTWFWQNGAEFFSPDKKKCLLDRPEAVQTFEFLGDLVQKARVNPPPSAPADQRNFASGKVGMFLSGSFSAIELIKQQAFQWDVAATPRGKKIATVMVQAAIAIPTGARAPDAAWRWIAWQFARRAVELTNASGNGGPVRKSFANDPKLNDFIPGGGDRVFFTAAEHAGAFLRRATIVRQPEFQQLWNEETRGLWEGTRSAGDVARTLTQRAGALLE